ncbi:MAG: TadE/TadG family type IV pilus assembly protein [Oscillospiraceae bacterium]|nr:TadE/TadG family type IV pilus assembly protein [Oscillospiraceae bacterium]
MKRGRSEKGQAMVEFALVLPLLLLLLCGIIDFGWIFYNNIMVDNAAREAARYSAIHVYDDGAFNSGDTADARTAALASSPILPDTLTATVAVSGDAVTVTVTSPTAVLTGLTSTIFGGKTVNLSSTSTMKLEQ